MSEDQLRKLLAILIVQFGGQVRISPWELRQDYTNIEGVEDIKGALYLAAARD